MAGARSTAGTSRRRARNAFDLFRRTIMIVGRVWPARPTFDGPLHDFDSIRRDLLRTLDLFGGDREPRSSAAGVFPPINVTQDADRYYVRAELPGIAANELSITAVRNR